MAIFTQNIKKFIIIAVFAGSGDLITLSAAQDLPEHKRLTSSSGEDSNPSAPPRKKAKSRKKFILVPQRPQEPAPTYVPAPSNIAMQAEHKNIKSLASEAYARILSFLPYQDCRNLAATCKTMRGSVLSNPVHSVNLVAERLRTEYVDPIVRVLLIAEGDPMVKLYGFEVSTAAVVNRLLSLGESIIKVNASSAHEYHEFPLNHRLHGYPTTIGTQQLIIPQGVEFTEEETMMCKQWIELENKKSTEKIDEFINRVKEAERLNPKTPLKITISYETVTADNLKLLSTSCWPELEQSPIFSIEFVDCTFPNGIGSISILKELRELILRTDDPNPFPDELCLLTNLKSLKINCFENLIVVPIHINSLSNLAILRLVNNQCHLPNITGELKIISRY